MINDIKITKNMKFDFEDLMREIDTNSEFTLKDLLRACIDSKIPLETLQWIIRCPYLKSFWEEMNSKRFRKDSNIEYLQLSWVASISEYKGVVDSGHSWHFDGVGKEGVIPQDLINHCPKSEIKKMIKEKYRQKYAIEFTPLYKLANYKIKFCSDIEIHDSRKKKYSIEKINVKPSITLVELLTCVFWELSFFGDPSSRDSKLKELEDRVENIDESKLVDWEEVKKKLLKRIKDIKNEK